MMKRREIQFKDLLTDKQTNNNNNNEKQDLNLSELSVYSYHSSIDGENKQVNQKNNDKNSEDENQEEILFSDSELSEQENTETYQKITAKKKSLREKNRYKNIKYILFPDDNFKIIWDLLLLFGMFFVCILAPFNMAFFNLNPENSPILYKVNILINCFFYIDMLLCFFTAYYDQFDKLIVNRRQIVSNYLKTFFLLDFISNFPFEYMIQKNYNNLLRLMRLQKVANIFRIVKFKKVSQMLEDLRRKVPLIQNFYNIFQVGPQMKRLILSMLSIILFNHVFACIWVLIGKSNNQSQSWINKTFSSSNINTQIPNPQPDITDLYITSFYWVTVTIITVGYGDIVAQNANEKIFSCFLMFIGVFFYSFTLGNITSMLSSSDEKNENFEKKINTLTQIKLKYNIDEILYQQIKSSFKYDNNLNIDDFLEQLPPRLKVQVVEYIYKDLVQGIHFFSENQDKRFLPTVGPLLKTVSIPKNTYIYKQNDYAEDMYFVKSGTLGFTIQNYEDFVFMKISKGSHFGEIDILLNQDRFTSVIAIEECELLSLNRKSFPNLFLKEFKSIGKKFYEKSIKRFQRIQIYQIKAIDEYQNKYIIQDQEYDRNFEFNFRKQSSQDLLQKIENIQQQEREEQEYYERKDMEEENLSIYSEFEIKNYSESENEEDQKYQKKLLNLEKTIQEQINEQHTKTIEELNEQIYIMKNFFATIQDIFQSEKNNDETLSYNKEINQLKFKNNSNSLLKNSKKQFYHKN